MHHSLCSGVRSTAALNGGSLGPRDLPSWHTLEQQSNEDDQKEATEAHVQGREHATQARVDASEQSALGI